MLNLLVYYFVGLVYIGFICLFKFFFFVEENFDFISFVIVVYELGYR